jgi:hypothetical protein
MRKFTNAMRLLMVVALSLTIVVGSAQRSTPLSNKAPQQQVLVEQVQIAPAQQMKAVQDNVITEEIKNLAKEQQPVTQFNYFGATEVLFSYDKPMSNEIYDPSKFPAPKQGGENFATALVINSLPYTDNGTTAGYVNDYDAVCPYTGSTSPDVVYSYTPATNKTIQVSLCNDPTNYDSKLYIMDAAQNVIACNDDYCSTASYPNPYVSYIGSAILTGGTTYYIVVDGYGGSFGNYQLTVNEVAPCIVTCPPGSTIEGEGTIPDEGADNFNGGCNSTPNIWGSIVPGQTVCGTSNTYTAGGNSSRDTDWYRFDGTSYGPGTWTFTWTAQAEFDLLIFIIKTNGGLCTGQTFWSATAGPCVTATVTQTGLVNDIFDFWVGPSVFTGYPPSGAPYDYVATLTGTFTPGGGPTGCLFTSQYPSSTIPVSTTGALTTISTCSYAGEYSIVSDIQAGQTYQFAFSDLGTGAYVTVADGPGGSGTVLAHGPSPLTYVAASGANLYLHWSLNSSCATDASCHVTTAQCTTCGGATPPPNDDCSNAQAVNGPYPVVGITGTTINSTIDCPSFLNETGVWYAINLPYVENKVIIDLCGTTLDNGWIVGFPDCSCSGAYYADSWNFAAPCVYDLTWNNIAGPGTFYYNVWTGSVQSNFVLDVDVQQAVPCVVTCPPGASLENEPTIPDEGNDVTNGGCNSATPIFTPITVGQTYCGTANTYLFGGSQYRDTDWYRLDLTGSPLFWDLTWTVTAEFPLIIFMVDAGTENCGDYTILGNTTAAPCVTASLTFTGLQPKVYWVLAMPSVFTGVPPSDYVATLTGVGVAPPVATFNPTSFTKYVAPGGSTSDVLAVGNTGGIGLNYTANVSYGAKASATIYPLNANYNTGTAGTAAFTQTSLMNGYGTEVGFAKFPTSGIPAGATILSINFNGYVNATSWPYWSITSLPYDPLVAAAADINSWTSTHYDDGVAYSYNTESSSFGTGWITRSLGTTAVADMQAALAQGWFSIGIVDFDFSTSYYINFDGWNEANKPYITVEYTTTPLWLTINGGQSTSGSVAPGGSNNIAVGFNATALSPGTYTANIVFTTNEPGAKATKLVPVTLLVGYAISGNVYYGHTGTGKPMATNTTVTCTPGPTVPTGALGAYVIRPLANGNYALSGNSTKPYGGLQALDAIQVQRFVAGAVAFTNLQRRAGDVNMSSSVQNLDATFIRRRVGSIAVPQWAAPNWIFDGPFGTPPALQGFPVTVAGSDVTVEFRTLCSGDVNNSYTPPAE